jgi:ATP-dependent Clp protease ATP-binding subunit ClpB
LQESYYSFEFTDSLKEYILDNAYSPQFGARPIKRFIQNNVETLIARAIVEGKVDITKKHKVDYVDGEVFIRD